MASSDVASGSQTAVIDTTHTLSTQNTAVQVLQLYVDLSNMANDDVLELIVEDKVLTTDTAVVIFKAIYRDVQALVVAVSPPLISVHSSVFKLLQTGGTGRTYSWAVKTP